MVFTAAQQFSFFEYSDQMGLSIITRTLYLIIEGIAAFDDLTGWDDGDWDQWNSNCKKSERVQDPNNAANIIAQVLFKVSFKSLKCPKIASKLIGYYDSVFIVVSDANIRWVVMNNFDIQKSLWSISPNKPN